MTQLFRAWLWEAQYNYITVEANSQEEADAIADAWILAGYPKGTDLQENFSMIRGIY